MATHTVFISHSHTDNDLCDSYVDALSQYGLDIWYDRTNLEVGSALSDAIEHELNSRSAMVVFLTPASIDSYWVKMELNAFRSLVSQDRKKLLLPVIIVPCEVPLLLRGHAWIDATKMSFDRAIQKISAALGATLKSQSQIHDQASSILKLLRPRVLVAEDAPTFRQAITRAIEDICIVDAPDTHEDLLALLKEPRKEYSLAIVDSDWSFWVHQTPPHNGEELLPMLRPDKTAGPTVVFYVQFVTPELRKLTKVYGAQLLRANYSSPAELRKAIENISYGVLLHKLRAEGWNV
ncbi:MAG TPA: TIR domain-containing protein [Ktedonobacteraceae bacterium]